MNRTDFGKLIAALRKEHEDENGVVWTQSGLAQEANTAAGADILTRDTIANIEVGRRRLDHQALVALATALQLTSGERREFFLAASGIESRTIPRQEADPKEILGQLIDRMKVGYLPAFIMDAYFDMVAVNGALAELMGFASAGLVLGTQANEPFSNDLMKFVFSEAGASHLGGLMGEHWLPFVHISMIVFRTYSLQHRSTPYFHLLLRELNTSRQFRRHWRDIYFEDKDVTLDTGDMVVHSPKWGLVSYFLTHVTGLTSAGELYLCFCVPSDPSSAEAFSRIRLDPDTASTCRVDNSWPRKPIPDQ